MAFALWFALIRRAPLNSLNVFSFLTPVFGLATDAAFYEEHLNSFRIAGGAWSSPVPGWALANEGRSNC